VAWLLLLLLLLLLAAQLVTGQPTGGAKDACAGSSAKIRQLVRQLRAKHTHNWPPPGTHLIFLLLLLPNLCTSLQILYSLRSSSPADVAAVSTLWRRRLAECRGLAVGGSSYGGHALTDKPAHFG
jgi:hypothetical protein